MNNDQLQRMSNDKGFIAALDQSGGSTPKALRNYGIQEDAYDSEEKMFDLVHEMRTRVIKSPSFDKKYILGAILFEQTMDREIDGLKTGDYLWEKKGIVPFLKVDKGLADEEDGVQVMKPMPQLDELLTRANERNIFGTKMRSVIKEANEEGIRKIAEQQFEVGKKIAEYGLVPILEPEVSIHCPDKAEAEKMLHDELLRLMKDWPEGKPVMFKLTIPTEANLYADLMELDDVVRVVALSGGYSREEANDLLSKNEGLIASFSRALLEGLDVDQSDEEFDATMRESVRGIYEASIT